MICNHSIFLKFALTQTYSKKMNLKPNRQTIRLKQHDYTSECSYFITICTHNRSHLFGDIINGRVVLNDTGKMAHRCWLQIRDHFPNTKIDEFIIMPNHIHGIIHMHPVPNVGANDDSRGWRANDDSPLRNRRWENGTSNSIGSIVRGFKIGVTKFVRQRNPEFVVWQRNYWEHIIRDKNQHYRIRQYIINNPVKWYFDKLIGGCGNTVLEPSMIYGYESWMV